MGLERGRRRENYGTGTTRSIWKEETASALEGFDYLRDHAVRDARLGLFRIVEGNLELRQGGNDILIGCVLE